jgi:hypothetical protein
MVDKLIDTSADIIDSIWSTRNLSNVMSTGSFIKEILKRSRTTFSALQLALFYLFRIKTSIKNYNQQEYKRFVLCGRRMFLAALMVASKYLNDRNYRNKTWAKIACLPVQEINKTEYIFLDLIQYELYVSKPLYDKWVYLLHHHIQKSTSLITPYTTINSATIHPTATSTIKLPWIYQEANSNTYSPVSSYTSSPDISTPSHTPPLVFNNNRKRPLSSSFVDHPIKHFKIVP